MCETQLLATSGSSVEHSTGTLQSSSTETTNENKHTHTSSNCIQHNIATPGCKSSKICFSHFLHLNKFKHFVFKYWQLFGILIQPIVLELVLL